MNEPPVETAELRAHYETIFADVSRTIDTARRASARSVNTVMKALYWLIGHCIVESEQSEEKRAEYVAMPIQRLAADLTQRFGRGYSRQNIQQMRLLYLSYPLERIRQTVSGKSDFDSVEICISELFKVFPLLLSTYVQLLTLKNMRTWEFYETEALSGGWTVRQLDRQIDSQFYKRTAFSKNKTTVLTRVRKAQMEDAVFPEEEIKDPFVLEFLDLKNEYFECNLEEAVLSRRGLLRKREVRKKRMLDQQILDDIIQRIVEIKTGLMQNLLTLGIPVRSN